MYPLNMINAGWGGYAVANDADEHLSLTGMGYAPGLVVIDADPAEADDAGHTVESLRAQLDALGIAYDKRIGVAKLLALLP